MLDAISPFNPAATTKWFVVDRKHGRGVVAKFDSPAMFAFHTVNAWQEPQSQDPSQTDIFCDIIQYPNLDTLHRLYYQNFVSTGSGVANFSGRESVQQSLVRYRLSSIPTASAPIKSFTKVNPQAEKVLVIPSPLIGDLPTINPSYSRQKHRFVYTLVDRGHSSFIDGIGKTDTETKDVFYWERKNHTPGEAIFVADPEGRGEDEGVLLSVVLDGDRGSSYLVCLDARTMTEVGRADVGGVVGLGFHGRHLRL